LNSYSAQAVNLSGTVTRTSLNRAELPSVALGFEPLGEWAIKLDLPVAKFALGVPWPINHPGAPGPFDGGAVGLPVAAASGGGVQVSSSGLGGSVVPMLAPVNLRASWRALLLLNTGPPPDVCLPRVAPSG